MVDIIDGALFQRMVIHGSASISAQKQAINDLNVFPVPDGDTGTNMSLTIGTAAAEAKKKPAQSIGKAASINASALLRGARGNSGVILSLLFRGVSKGLKERDEADGAAFRLSQGALFRTEVQGTESGQDAGGLLHQVVRFPCPVPRHWNQLQPSREGIAHPFFGEEGDGVALQTVETYHRSFA